MPAPDPPSHPAPRLSRRRFVAALAAAAGGIALRGVAVEPRALRVTRHAVGRRRAPDPRPVILAQITDLHLLGVGAVHRRIGDALAAARPDLVVITGDSLDYRGSPRLLAEFMALLDPATPKFAILGNWEHWHDVDVDAMDAVYRRAGCRLLVNETAVHEVRGRSLAITGLDDMVAGRPDPRRAFADVPAVDAHLLLAHCPEHRDVLARHVVFDVMDRRLEFDLSRITLMLSGHTHGGQVNLFGWAPVLPRGSGRYVRGWFREPGAIPLYVSRGIGTSSYPVRLGSPPELALFDLYL